MKKSFDDATKTAMFQLIIRSQLLSFKVLSSSIGIWLVSAYFVYQYRVTSSEQNFWLMIACVVIVAVLSLLLAMQATRNVTIETILKLEKTPQEEWFWVTGVTRASNCFVIHVRDFFGHNKELYSYCENPDDFHLSRKWKIACALESQWKPIVEKLGAIKKEPSSEKEVESEGVTA